MAKTDCVVGHSERPEDRTSRLKPPQLRLLREAIAETFGPPALTSTDSGYNSLETSPQKPAPGWEVDVRKYCDVFHGGHDSDEELESTEDEAEHKPFVPQTRPEAKPTHEDDTPKKTIPFRRLPSQKRPALPPGFFSDSGGRLLRRASDAGSARGKRACPRFLDRFVPPRDHLTDPSLKFRTTRAPAELSPSEKLLRHAGATTDAFCFRLRRSAPMASDYRASVRTNGGPVRMGVGTTLGPVSENDNSGTGRQVSP